MVVNVFLADDFDENELQIGDILWYINDDLSVP